MKMESSNGREEEDEVLTGFEQEGAESAEVRRVQEVVNCHDYC